MEKEIFKGNQRVFRISPCEIDTDSLIKLFEVLKKINEKALQLELARVDKINKNLAKPLPKKKLQELKKHISEQFQVHIEIASERDFISSQSPSIFTKRNLPSKIMRIKFDNSFYYRATFDKEPIAKFVVELDFRKLPLSNLSSNPSLSTDNSSYIRIFGEDTIWVEGSFNQISDLLKEGKTRRGWFHKNNVYDVFLWLLIIPIAFWNLYKLEIGLNFAFKNLSAVFVVFLYIFIFLFIFLFFRFLFAYLRWLFPYIEFRKPDRRGYRFHRFIVSLFTVSALGALIYDILKSVITLIF